MDAEEELDPKSVAVEDSIIGDEHVTLGEHGPGAIEAKPMPSPKAMTPQQRAKHFISHLPYDPDCEVCVACKRPNIQHKASHEDKRTIPLLVGDYGFIRDSRVADNITVLFMRLYPFRMNFACTVTSKGTEPLIVARIARWITECGLVHFAYRSDKEPAIVAMIQQACAMAGRNGVLLKGEDDADRVSTDVPLDRALVAIPEHNHPGESQSNGLSEKGHSRSG